MTRHYDELTVVIHPDATTLGREAAQQAAKVIEDTVASDGRAAIILASANSQLQFLHELAVAKVSWARVTILHMDEYVGISEDHPASFRRFLRLHLIDRLPEPPAAFRGIDGEASDVESEMERYAEVLAASEPCLCVLGIGENGHLAFNEPPADHFTAARLQRVVLDETSRKQQVGEGHFPDLASVPRDAISLTIPALLAPRVVIGVVPESRKARAVATALEGAVSPECPASALRHAPHATLHLDRDSASMLKPHEAG